MRVYKNLDSFYLEIVIYNIKLRILSRYFLDKQTSLTRQIPYQAYMLVVTEFP